MTVAKPSDVLGASQRFAWLRLYRSKNIGPRTFQDLLKRFGSAENALEALPDLLKRTNPGRPIRIAEAHDIEQELEAAKRLGAGFICSPEPAYPALLREIDSAPPVIAVRGHKAILDRPPSPSSAHVMPRPQA